MRKYVFFTILSFITVYVFSQQELSEQLINSLELSLPLEIVNIELDKLETVHASENGPDVLRKVFLLFRKSLLTKDEEHARTTFAYLDEFYQSHAQYQIPVMQAYRGTSRASIADTLKNPIPRLALLKEGIEWIDTAIADQEALNKQDNLSLGFIYFLRGRTLASVPSFIGSSKEAQPNLKTALSYYKNVQNIDPMNIANVFYAYAITFMTRGKIAVAIRNMKQAKKYANPYFAEEIETHLAVLESR